MYAVAARIQGAGVHRGAAACATGFALDAAAVIAALAGARSSCSSARRTTRPATCSTKRDARVCAELAGRALVVVDEAYVEFCRPREPRRRGSADPNLVVLRTLSKAYALAGARCGTLIASADIVGLLRRIIPPYAIPASTVEEVLAPDRGAAARAWRAARIARCSPSASRMRRPPRALRRRRAGLSSDANFLLVECRDAGARLRGRQPPGLIVRDFRPTPGLANCLRITVGTPDQNRRLLAAVEPP